jgi:Yip1 domain
MSEANPGPSTVAASQGGPGFLGDLFGLYFGPKEAFTNIVKKPSFWAPLLVFVVLQMAFTGVWLHHLDMLEFMRTQAEESGRPFQAPPESAMGFVRGIFWVSAVLITPIIILVVSAVYLFVFRFFLATEVTFKQAFTIVAYAFLAVALVHTPLILLTMALKGDWNIDPRVVVAANPTAFLEKAATAKPLWALLQSLDLFYLWTIFLVAVGFGVAAKRTTGQVMPAVLVPWGIVVAILVGVAALL